jgi:YidC/Oxa1 family membrane protein insertase
MAQPAVSVPTGTSITREYAIYAGPKDPEQLAAVGAQLDRSIDLGWSWMAPLTRAFAWLLKACYAVIPNYGVAIILLTVMVRLCTAPLAAKQMKSMKRMGEIQPKMKALQEKHKDDRQQQSQEMMKLYKEAGVNPLGGCLPMVFQIPVFIGLYYALQSSIDLRQAPFMLWIDDLSRPETLFAIPGVGWPVRVLPVLMTLSMVLQQRMTPMTTMDPVQARTMMIVMPVMFFFMFYGFPAGLVLYWFVSNLLAIAQQLYLNRQLTPQPA